MLKPPTLRHKRLAALLGAGLCACGSNPGTPAGDGGRADGAGGDAVTVPMVCASQSNAPGAAVDFAWPAASNVGNDADPGRTVHFHWAGVHDVIQVAYWDSSLTNPGFPRGLYSGAPAAAPAAFDWNVGVFPCGYRPGIYFFADEGNAVNGVVAISVTDAENTQHHYDPRPCSALADPAYYGGRYAAFATRAGCTQYEVNNFQTETHFDWVQPTFGATQGDVLVFRWTGIHNVVQVHDADQDQPVAPGAVVSGPRTHCVGGPNYGCANGDPTLGEFALDTADWRPGMIHISDQCAFNRADCPLAHTGSPSPTGMNMEFLLARPAAPRPVVSAPGACCAIDRTRGQACRVIDAYNDHEGSQFDYNFPVNRGDLVRLRWAGSVRIVQTGANMDGSPSRTPRGDGVGMTSAVECVPGPHWTCLGGNTEQAQLVVDVEQLVASGRVDPGGQFNFYAFGENTPGGSSQDSGIHFYLAQTTAYDPNPPCP